MLRKSRNQLVRPVPIQIRRPGCATNRLGGACTIQNDGGWVAVVAPHDLNIVDTTNWKRGVNAKPKCDLLYALRLGRASSTTPPALSLVFRIGLTLSENSAWLAILLTPCVQSGGRRVAHKVPQPLSCPDSTIPIPQQLALVLSAFELIHKQGA